MNDKGMIKDFSSLLENARKSEIYDPYSVKGTIVWDPLAKAEEHLCINHFIAVKMRVPNYYGNPTGDPDGSTVSYLYGLFKKHEGGMLHMASDFGDCVNMSVAEDFVDGVLNFGPIERMTVPFQVKNTEDGSNV